MEKLKQHLYGIPLSSTRTKPKLNITETSLPDKIDVNLDDLALDSGLFSVADLQLINLKFQLIICFFIKEYWHGGTF